MAEELGDGESGHIKHKWIVLSELGGCDACRFGVDPWPWRATFVSDPFNDYPGFMVSAFVFVARLKGEPTLLSTSFVVRIDKVVSQPILCG